MRLVVLVLGLLLVIAAAYETMPKRHVLPGSSYEVGLVYQPELEKQKPFLRAAYDAVLDEEGTAHRWFTVDELFTLDFHGLPRRVPALIFPDGLDRTLRADAADRLAEYMQAGGHIALIFDVGVQDPTGTWRFGGALAQQAGVEYLQYDQLREGTYRKQPVRFVDAEAARAWGIPPGRLNAGRVLGAYSYGGLIYPVALAHVIAAGTRVYATSTGGSPIITLRHQQKGSALWVGLPLGYIKAYSDDLLLRCVLRGFLFDVVKVPHLVAAPGGVGGLILNWHIDDHREAEGIPNLAASGILRPDLRYEFDVTAGPDDNAPGDGAGFNACGPNASLVQLLMRYGDIGDHGGWLHNYFAFQLVHGLLTPAQTEEYVRLNSQCLQSITGTPVRTYAAPEGVHPQPDFTRILERAGINAYYYAGDIGSAPNRTFARGSIVSPTAWAFPTMPDGFYVSLGEMLDAWLTADDVETWLNTTLDYIVNGRTIRLVYSHSYDLLLATGYIPAFKRFLDRLEAMQREGRIRVEPMEYFATFLTRFLKTRASYSLQGRSLLVALDNPEQLKDISMFVPSGWRLDPSIATSSVSSRASPGGDSILTMADGVHHVELRLLHDA